MRTTYKDLMHLNSPVVEEMQWWHDEMHQWSGKAIISARCQMVVTTDASGLGWGDGGDLSATPASSRTKLGGSGYLRRRA